MEVVVSNAKSENTGKAPQSKSLTAEFYEWAATIVFALAIVAVIFMFFARPVSVSGFSMQNTLQNDDKVIITNFNYAPKQGDIIVMYSKGLDTTIIKRVVAVGGQTVDIDYTKNKVYVDGKEFTAPIKEKMIDPENGFVKVKLPLKVPAGCAFVMGDNRNDSIDSRFAKVGIINDKDVLGHAVFRLLPLNKIGLLH